MVGTRQGDLVGFLIV